MTTFLLPSSQFDTVSRAAVLNQSGNLVGIPTETVYGLGANGLDENAVSKIFIAKGRPQDNPLILHVAGSADVPQLCHNIPPCAFTLMEKFWPGPLTLILPAKEHIPRATTAGLDTVGVRCPASQVTRNIILASGVPIAAPSANLSGKPSPTTAQHVLHDMTGRIAAIVDDGPCSVGVESTIVDLTGSRPRLLRPGGITLESLCEILGEIDIDPAVTEEISNHAVVRAPGMKYTHYSPAGEVIIVTGSSADAAAYIKSKLGPQDRVLCFQEELSLYPPMVALAYGSADNPTTLAQGLFSALRELDRQDIPTIYARCPSGDGITQAVANRLKKAAGFHIVEGGRKQ